MIAHPRADTQRRPDPCCDVAAPEPPHGLAAAAALFKALSDETRLRILRTLARYGELCECNIVPSFGLSQPTISYHLKVLREAGLIQSRRQGQWVYHSLDPKALLRAISDLTAIQCIDGHQ